MKIVVTLPNAEAVTIDVPEEWTLKEGMHNAGVAVVAQCGGACACATCHVHVALEWRAKLAPPDEDEIAMAEVSDFYDPAASRLSCQILCRAPLEGLEVVLQEDSWEG